MKDYSTKTKIRLSAMLLFVAGFVDITAFILGGRMLIVFMGGNITNLNYSIFTLDLHDFLRFGGIILIFALGSFAGSFTNAKIKNFHNFFIFEIILAISALSCAFYTQWVSFYILCFMIGYQNALKFKVKDITISESFITSIISGFGYYSARRLLNKENSLNFLMLVFKVSLLFVGNIIGFLLIYFAHAQIQVMFSIIIMFYILIFLYTKHFMKQTMV